MRASGVTPVASTMIAPAPPQGYKYPITFEVDLESPDCIRPLDGAHRREPVLK